MQTEAQQQQPEQQAAPQKELPTSTEQPDTTMVAEESQPVPPVPVVNHEEVQQQQEEVKPVVAPSPAADTATLADANDTSDQVTAVVKNDNDSSPQPQPEIKEPVTEKIEQPKEDVEMRPMESTQAPEAAAVEVVVPPQPAEQQKAQVQEPYVQQQPKTNRFIPKPSDPEALKQQQESGFVYVDADIYQAAMINKQLPQGFRIDLEETVFKQIKQRADALKNSLKNAKKMEVQRSRAMYRQQTQQVQATHLAKRPAEPQAYAHASNSAVASNNNSINIDSNSMVIDSSAAQINQPTSNQDLLNDNLTQKQVSESENQLKQQQIQPLPQVSTPVEGDLSSKEPATGLNDTPATEGKRTTRERKAIDYNSMASGQANLSYQQENTQQAPQRQHHTTAKKPGQKLVQETFRKCCDLIKQLKEKKGADHLEMPLDPNHAKYQDLKKDFKLLSLVEKNLHDQRYQTTYNMALDLRKMFTNRIRQFQTTDCEVSTQLLDISSWFEETFEAMDLDNKNIYIQNQSHSQNQVASQQQVLNAQVIKKQANQIQKLEKKVTQIISKTDRKKSTTNTQSSNKQPSSNTPSVQQVQQPAVSRDDAITMEEKTQIKNNIQYLTNAQQQGIIDLVKDCINQKAGQVFEFELDQLPVKKCRALEKYVNDCIKDNERKRKRRQSDQQRRQRQKQLKQMNEKSQQKQSQAPSSSQQTQQQQKQYEQMPVDQVAAILGQNPNLKISDKKRLEVNQYIIQQQQQTMLAQQQQQLQAQQQAQKQHKSKQQTNGDHFNSDQSSSSSSDDDEGFPPLKKGGANVQDSAPAEGDLTQMWSNIQSSQQANK